MNRDQQQPAPREPGLGPVPVGLDAYTRDPVTNRPGEPVTVRELWDRRAANRPHPYPTTDNDESE